MKSFRSILTILAFESALVAGVDQVTKAIIREQISPADTITLIPGLLSLVHWRNTGIAFGMLQEHGEILTLIGFIALIGIPILFWWEWRRDASLAPCAWGLGLILGGAMGNLIDRMRFGEVTDFIDVYVGSHHWPAFNVADSCICIGTALVLYFAYRGSSAIETPEINPES